MTITPLPMSIESLMRVAARRAAEETVKNGAEMFLSDPWRIRRVIQNAHTYDSETLKELIEHRVVVLEEAIGNPVIYDMSDHLALKQARCAIHNPDFPKIWARYRAECYEFAAACDRVVTRGRGK